MVEVKFKKLNPEAKVPYAAYEHPACFDLYSVEDVYINPGEVKAVSTGIAIELPKNYEAQVRPRSGLALKHGVTVLNSPGTIDPDYRGEVKVIMHNTSPYSYQIKSGERIAQMAIRQFPNVEFVEVSELSETERGEGGFGSSGK